MLTIVSKISSVVFGGKSSSFVSPKKGERPSRPQTSPLILVYYHIKGEHYHIKGDDKSLAEGPLQAQPGKLGEPDFLCFTYLITTVLRWSVPTSIQKYQTTMWKTW